MIKILNEEPVAYDTGIENDLDNPDAWIYKNPTQKEVDSLNKRVSVRILTYKSDFYLANGYYFIHCFMADALRSYTKLNYNDYNTYYIRLDTNRLMTGDIYNEDYKLKVLQELKPFIPRFKELGLVNDSTVVRYYTYEENLVDFYRGL